MQSAQPAQETLSAEGLSKRYGARTVVESLSLEVAPGEVVGLLGPNGAGKSTTFHMICGALKPSAGRVRLGARDITALPMYRRARLGVVVLPQETCVFRKLSVENNVRAILETVEKNAARRRQRLQELLAELGLSARAKQRAESLSGGERRRLEITRALVLRPKFLLLDEPFAGIDPISVGEVQRVIAQLKARGIGIIITEHKVREALNICDSVCIMLEGELRRRGAPAEIIADPAVRENYLGADFRAD